MNKTVKMTVEVTFDEDVTDAESVSNALDTLLETTLSTQDILSDVGNPRIGKFIPELGPWVVSVTQVVDRLQKDDVEEQPAGSGGNGSCRTYAIHAATTEDEALDIFHSTYPISALDDFEIDCDRCDPDDHWDEDCHELHK